MFRGPNHGNEVYIWRSWWFSNISLASGHAGPVHFFPRVTELVPRKYAFFFESRSAARFYGNRFYSEINIITLYLSFSGIFPCATKVDLCKSRMLLATCSFRSYRSLFVLILVIRLRGLLLLLLPCVRDWSMAGRLMGGVHAAAAVAVVVRFSQHLKPRLERVRGLVVVLSTWNAIMSFDSPISGRRW